MWRPLEIKGLCYATTNDTPQYLKIKKPIPTCENQPFPS